MAEIVSTSTALKTGKFVFLHRYTVQKMWKHFMIRCSLAKTQILVLGRSGVGKSVLTSIVRGEAGDHTWEEPGISQDVEINAITLKKLTKVITVVPGQNVIERRVALDKHFYKNTLDGIIYVADWGFTDLRSDFLGKKLVEAGEDSLEKIRAYHLKSELEDFSKIIESLITIRSNNSGPSWLLVAVTKFDLFADDESEVRKYYEDQDGEFFSIIKELLTAIGENNIKVKICYVSSKLDNFEWNGTTIRPQLTSESVRRQKFSQFVKELTELSK